MLVKFDLRRLRIYNFRTTLVIPVLYLLKRVVALKTLNRCNLRADWKESSVLVKSSDLSKYDHFRIIRLMSLTLKE